MSMFLAFSLCYQICAWHPIWRYFFNCWVKCLVSLRSPGWTKLLHTLKSFPLIHFTHPFLNFRQTKTLQFGDGLEFYLVEGETRMHHSWTSGVYQGQRLGKPLPPSFWHGPAHPFHSASLVSELCLFLPIDWDPADYSSLKKGLWDLSVAF